MTTRPAFSTNISGRCQQLLLGGLDEADGLLPHHGGETGQELVNGLAAFEAASPWETIISYDVAGWNNVVFDSSGAQYFYRIRAVEPLSP